MDISERGFEEAIEAALLLDGPDALAEAGAVRDVILSDPTRYLS